MIVPWPFGRIAIVVGEPRVATGEVGSPELEAERQALERRLSELTRQAEAAVGARDPLGDD